MGKRKRTSREDIDRRLEKIEKMLYKRCRRDDSTTWTTAAEAALALEEIAQAWSRLMWDARMLAEKIVNLMNIIRGQPTRRCLRKYDSRASNSCSRRDCIELKRFYRTVMQAAARIDFAPGPVGPAHNTPRPPPRPRTPPKGRRRRQDRARDRRDGGVGKRR